MSDIIELYNPQNAKALDPKQIEAMQNLSTEQIETLAKAYPNQARGNNYLVLINTTLPADKQVYQLSTWNNLAALRRLNQNQFSAYSFQPIFNNKASLPQVGAGKGIQATVVDLSGTEQLPGFKPSEVRTDPAIPTEGPTPAKLVPTEDTATQATVEYDLSNPDIKAAVDEVNDQKAKLDQLVTDKAHHMTIKAQQGKVDEAQELLTALTTK